MFLILSYILQILNFSFTIPPSKITDFCHLPLHSGGFGCFFDSLKKSRRVVPAAFDVYCDSFLVQAAFLFSTLRITNRVPTVRTAPITRQMMAFWTKPATM